MKNQRYQKRLEKQPDYNRKSSKHERNTHSRYEITDILISNELENLKYQHKRF